MVKLKLTLKSNKPSNVYALNGKSYRLQPGSNTLVLEYNDYVSLAKALGIKPVEKDETPSTKKESQKPAPVEEVKKEEPVKTEESIKKEEPVNEPKQEEPTHTDESETAAAEEPKAEEHIEEKEPEHTEEPVEEKEEIDYSTWSLSKLKVEYKRITGNTCKLKKAEVIQFLQEHNSNV